MIVKPGDLAGQSGSRAIPSFSKKDKTLDDLWHGALSCWNSWSIFVCPVLLRWGIYDCTDNLRLLVLRQMYATGSYLYSGLIAVYHFLPVKHRNFSFFVAPFETSWNLFLGQKRFSGTPSPEKPIFQQTSSNTTGVIFVSICPVVFEQLRCKFRTHYWEASKNIFRFFGSFRCSAWSFLAFNPAVFVVRHKNTMHRSFWD